MSNVRRYEITYRAGDLEMTGTIYKNDIGQAATAVLIFPEAPGPGENVHEHAERLAHAGHIAMVSDLHGRGELLADMDTIMAKLGALRSDVATTRLRARAALDMLCKAEPTEHVVAMGFCFGGTMALELGRDGARLSGIIGFHCGLMPLSDQQAAIKCSVLVCIGADDPSILPAHRAAFEDEMRTGQVDWMMQLYGGVVHSFTDRKAELLGRPGFARYDARADRESWAAALRFLDRAADPAWLER